MKVKDLIQKLQKIDPEALVVISGDAEGNGYSPLDSLVHGNTMYVADSSWSGEVKLARLTPELEKRGYSEEDCAPDGVPCVVLRPVN